MKKKIVLSILFIISLIPMAFNQYGAAKGVQEISGLINLFNPLGLIAFIAFFVGIWIEFKKQKVNKILGVVGVIGIVLSEIYKFLTWYIPNYQNSTSLQYSFNNAFSEYYVGIVISFSMVILYFVLDKKLTE